jgi:hypothetical protein
MEGVFTNDQNFAMLRTMHKQEKEVNHLDASQ